MDYTLYLGPILMNSAIVHSTDTIKPVSGVNLLHNHHIIRKTQTMPRSLPELQVLMIFLGLYPVLEPSNDKLRRRTLYSHYKAVFHCCDLSLILILTDMQPKLPNFYPQKSRTPGSSRSPLV